MNIVHIIFGFNVGGAETMLIDISNEQSLSNNVTVIIINNDYSKELLLGFSSSVKIIYLNRPLRSRSPLYFLRFNYLLRKCKPHIIHCHNKNIVNFIIGYPAPLIVTAHCILPDLSGFKSFKTVACISRYVEDDLNKRGISNTNVIPNGINCNFISRSNSGNELASDISTVSKSFRIVSCGRLSNEGGRKRQDILIKALSLLPPSFQYVTVTFIGDGDERPLLEKLTADLDLSDRVSFMGSVPRSKIYAILSHFDLMVHSCLNEAFGLTVIEGMAAGLPVLVSDIGGPAEVTLYGELGFLFETGNEKDCARMIEYIISHPEESILKSYKGAEVVRSTYNISKTAQSYLQLYESNVK